MSLTTENNPFFNIPTFFFIAVAIKEEEEEEQNDDFYLQCSLSNLAFKEPFIYRTAKCNSPSVVLTIYWQPVKYSIKRMNLLTSPSRPFGGTPFLFTC